MRALAVSLALLAVACPPDDKASPGAGNKPPPAACARFGQTCELSPGKLGTCVQKDGCVDTTPACFVCQSQH